MVLVPNRQFGLFDRLFKKKPDSEEETQPKKSEAQEEVDLEDEASSAQDFKDTEEQLEAVGNDENLGQDIDARNQTIENLGDEDITN